MATNDEYRYVWLWWGTGRVDHTHILDEQRICLSGYARSAKRHEAEHKFGEESDSAHIDS